MDVYADALLQGRRSGPPGSTVAFETRFGWVLTGSTSKTSVSSLDSIASFHVAITSGDGDSSQFLAIESSKNNFS